MVPDNARANLEADSRLHWRVTGGRRRATSALLHTQPGTAIDAADTWHKLETTGRKLMPRSDLRPPDCSNHSTCSACPTSAMSPPAPATRRCWRPGVGMNDQNRCNSLAFTARPLQPKWLYHCLFSHLSPRPRFSSLKNPDKPLGNRNHQPQTPGLISPQKISRHSPMKK